MKGTKILYRKGTLSEFITQRNECSARLVAWPWRVGDAHDGYIWAVEKVVK